MGEYIMYAEMEHHAVPPRDDRPPDTVKIGFPVLKGC